MHTKPFEEIALGRRSIRQYDENMDIPRREVEEILRIAVAAPFSSNMQPWRFVVVNRAEAKEKILPHARFNVAPVKTASAVIAIYGDLESTQNAGRIMDETAQLRKQSVDEIFPASDDKDAPPRPQIPEGKSPREMIMGFYNSMTRDKKTSIALIDCGLVTMQLMQAARMFGYDTCALGAYDKEAVGKALGMDDARYVPVMLLTIGKAAQAGAAPYRLPVAEIAKFIG